MTPANRFKLARVRLGLTQEEAARRAGLPLAYVVTIENSRSVKRRLALAYGMPLRDEDDEPRSTNQESASSAAE